MKSQLFISQSNSPWTKSMHRGIIKAVIIIILATFILSLFGVQSILNENEQLKIENEQLYNETEQLQIENSNLQTKLNLSQTQITTLNSEITTLKITKSENFVYPRNWASLSELYEFIEEDQTNTELYIDSVHDCDDFAIELQQNALQWRDGLFLGTCILTKPNGALHMENIAIIGNNIYLVEPQNDAIKLYCTVD